MSEAHPSTQPMSEEALRLVLVDQSRDAQDEARDIADARLDKELGEGGGFKKFVNGIWKGNIAKDYYRQKYVNQALETIQNNDNVLADSPADRRTRALESTIERFQSDYDELIHTEAGESREVLADDSQLASGVKHLIREFVEGRLNATTLREERTRLLNSHYHRPGAEEADRKKGIATADNLLDIAQAVAGVVEHGESLDNALGRLEVITGEARNGARTEARYNAVDKGVDWLSKRGVASFVTPGALAVGVAAGMAIVRSSAQSVTVAVTKTLIPGAAAAAWAGVRENKRVKDERAQHSREMATGGQFEESDKRRVEMEKARYDAVSATMLVENLRGKASREYFEESGSEAVQAALEALAAVQARVQLSDTKKLDLISYSSKEAVGEERMMLDLARRDVRLALESSLTPDVRTELSIDHDKDIRDLLQEKSDLFTEVLLGEEISEKDKAFAKLKSRRVAKAAAIGAATGIVGGLITQEVIAGIDPDRYGLIDMARGVAPEIGEDGEVNQTIVAGFIRGEETVVHTEASTEYDRYSTADNGVVELSDDHTLEPNEDGTFSIVDGNGEASVEGLVVDANGTFDQASLDKLEDAGMVVEDKSFNETVVTETTQEVTADQYIQNHMAETTAVTRDFWYANNTPNVFDQNELRVYRGGSDAAPGIIEGGYQYTVAGMSPSGSYQGGESVDWNQAAANGNLFVAVSGTYDTQGNPFMIPIGPDGAVNIPADSPAGQFFANENNSVAFNGAYMEIVQVAGVDEEGVTHIRPLATVVGDASAGAGGEGGDTITDTVTTETIVHHTEYSITTNGYDTVQQNSTESAPITPIASRRSMEALKTSGEAAPGEPVPFAGLETPVESLETSRGYDYYPGGATELERQQILKELSPRLQNNPNAELNTAEELNWFRGEVVKRKGEAYVNAVETFVDNDPSMQRISSNTETIVTIPVAAAYEADNIYKTLSLYAQQDSESLSKFALLLNVNWLDTVMDDPQKVEAMQKTIAEIERAKRNFPDLIVSVMQREYNEEQVSKTGGVIGYAMEDLVDTSLLAAQRKVATGVMQSDQNVLIVRADADTKGLSRTMIKNYQREIGNNGDIDIVQGAIRYGVDESVKFPGYGIVSNLMAMFQGVATQENSIHTVGINFGVRASTLAAVGGVGGMLEERDSGSRLEAFTGAGSDDVRIGQRVAIARGIDRAVNYPYGTAYTTNNYQQNGSIGVPPKRVKLVAGATTDTSAERLLPVYLSGRSPDSVWARGINEGYADGPGGYRERTAGQDSVATAERDNFNNDAVYELIERSLDEKLSYASERTGRKVLGLLFGSVAGAYTLSGEIGTRDVHIKLTKEGRDFIKNRVKRETNGKFGPYGMRKMRQLYGITKPGAKRQPASSVAPLVSPLS